MHADEPWRRYTKDEMKTLGKQASNLKRHYMQDLHDMPGCAKDMLLKEICTWLH